MNKKLLFLLSVMFLSFTFIPAESVIETNPQAVEALSRCLREKNATMYGTANCGHCNRQKDMFGPYFRNVRFVDCRANNTNAKECNQAKVGKFPQWNFDNGRKIVREASLDQIAEYSDCREYVARAVGSDLLASAESTSSALNKQSDYGSSISSSNQQTRISNASNSNSQSSVSFGTPEELAKCLKDKGVIFYGSPRCSHCNKQKDMFQGAFEQYLSANFHNCKGSDAEQLECSRKGTFPFPTWIEPSTGKKLTGPERSLETIAQTFNCTVSSNAGIKTASYQRANIQQPTSLSDSQTGLQSSSNNTDYPPSADYQQIQEQGDSASTSVQSDISTNNSGLERPPSESTLASAASASFYDAQAILLQKQNRLAKCLVNRNIILYGVTDSQKGKFIQYKATQDQLQELGEAAKQIKVVDCSSGQAECSGILVYPTWILDDKKELAGVYELNNLAQILGCSIDE